MQLTHKALALSRHVRRLKTGIVARAAGSGSTVRRRVRVHLEVSGFTRGLRRAFVLEPRASQRRIARVEAWVVARVEKAGVGASRILAVRAEAVLRLASKEALTSTVHDGRPVESVREGAAEIRVRLVIVVVDPGFLVVLVIERCSLGLVRLQNVSVSGELRRRRALVNEAVAAESVTSNTAVELV